MAATTTPRERPARRGRYAKTAETRARILESAWQVARDRGFHDVSLSEVASRAGVAAGNVSYHFGSRDDLLAALISAVAERVEAQVLRPAGEGDYFERLESGLRAYLDFVRSHPDYVRMGEEMRHHRPDLHRRYVDAWLDLHREAIRDGIEQGDLRALGDAEISASAHVIVGFCASFEGMTSASSQPTPPDDEAVVATFMRMLRGGLERGR